MSPAAKTITLEELKDKIVSGEPFQLVNVLPPEHYSLGLLPGSLRIPLTELDRRVNELDKSQDVVTYSADFESSASKLAAEKLAALGFRAKAYEGGVQEWKDSGEPVENDENRDDDEESIDRPSGLSGLPNRGR